MKAEVRLLGIATLRDELRELYKSVTTSKRSVMERIADRFASVIRGRLQSESGRKALDPDTLATRRSRGIGGTDPLVATGAMLASISTDAGEDYAVAGPTSEYAAHVQFGFRHASGVKVPGRPFVWLDRSDVDDAMDMVEEYLFGAV